MESLPLVLVTTFSPFAAFLLALLLLMRRPAAAQTIVVLGAVASLLGAVTLLWRGPGEPLRFLWFKSGELQLQFGFLLDGTSLLFGAVVALITLCVVVYSLGYMAEDPDKTRYFAMLGFFAWAMLVFVYAVDLLQAFIFWELVGLASFFLIGFWYEKPSAAAAAKKAFLMTRVGDIGLFIGILLILGITANFDMPTLLDADSGLARLAAPESLALITLLLFVGVVGKSAQFPLHTWLPDAMEGPTPVSALLHSATMVAAGVFLMARLHPLFMEAESTRLVVLGIATFTALLASTIAMVEKDIKKVLAYSSISQLGFMLMALAAGSLFAGVFHLVTHAIFKALLFLCAGAYIHHLGTNDIAEIGRRGGRRMKLTTAGLVIGGAALAGVPPLAGFFSKEEIFAQLGHDGFSIFMFGAFAAAFLTAYYTFRMIFQVLVPAQEEHAATHHGNPEPPSMMGPILLLSLGALALGFFGGDIAAALGINPEKHSLVSMLPAIGVTLLGIAVAWLDYGRPTAARRGFVTAVPAVHSLFENKWYVDAFYQAVIVRITTGAAKLFHWVENSLLDNNYDRLGQQILGTGTRATRLQNGWVQFYAGCGFFLLAAVSLYLGLR